MLQPAVGEGVNIGPEEKIATRLAGRQTDTTARQTDMAARQTDMAARQTDMAARQTDTVQKTGKFYDSHTFFYLDMPMETNQRS